MSRKDKKPLEKEQLYEYINRYQEGEVELASVIAQHNIDLVFSVIQKRFDKVPYGKLELLSVGIEGLIKSLSTFDLSRGLEFSTYAFSCISGEIGVFLRKEKRHNSFENIYDKSVLLYSRDIDISDPVEKLEQEAVKLEIRKMVYSLQDPYKDIIISYFDFENRGRITQKELAKKYNVLPKQISRYIDDSIKIIKQNLLESFLIDNDRYISDCAFDKVFRTLQTGTKGNVFTFYEHFQGWKEEDIKVVIERLSEEELRIIKNKFGDDFFNSDKVFKLSNNSEYRFLGTIKPKIKESLQEKAAIEKDIFNQSLKGRVTTNDYRKILDMVNSNEFEQMAEILTSKIALVVCLNTGYLCDKEYSIGFISKFLGIEEEQIRDTIECGKKIITQKQQLENNLLNDFSIKIKTKNKVVNSVNQN